MESSRVTLDRCPVCGDLVQRGAGCQRCQSGQPLGQPPAKAVRSRGPLPISARTIAIVLVLIALVAGGVTVWALNQSRAEEKPPANGQQAVLSLGELPSIMPQSEEATLLLALLTREPGKTHYEIDYRTGGVTVAFAYSPGSDIVTREQRGTDGHGEKSVWTGYGADRLQGAAAGATLSDTPDGLADPQTSSF
jgi:hypothetical protein